VRGEDCAVIPADITMRVRVVVEGGTVTGANSDNSYLPDHPGLGIMAVGQNG